MLLLAELLIPTFSKHKELKFLLFPYSTDSTDNIVSDNYILAQVPGHILDLNLDA